MKNLKNLALVSVSLFILSGCGTTEQLVMPNVDTQAANQNVGALAKKEVWNKIAAKKTTTTKKKVVTNGGSYSANLRFEFGGSMFTSVSEDVSDFLERFGRDIDDWQLDELDNDSWDQLGKRRFKLSIYGPDRNRLDEILSLYRDHLRSIEI